jgi:hypothetical protein
MIGAGHIWPIASAWFYGIAAGPRKNSPPMHDMIDRRVRAFLQGLARSLTGVHGGRLYRAVQNGEFSYRYAAPPRIEATSRPAGLPRPSDHQRVVARQRQRRMPPDLARELLTTSSSRRFDGAIRSPIGQGTPLVRQVWHPETHCYRRLKPATVLPARRSSNSAPCQQTPVHFIHTPNLGSSLYRQRPWIAHMTRFFVASNSWSRRAK